MDREEAGSHAVKIVYFDCCALLVFAALLLALHVKKLTVGVTSRLFLAMLWVSFAATAADVVMEFVVGAPPLSAAAVGVGYFLSYTYKVLRNGTNILYILFLFAVTRTTYRLRKRWVRCLLLAPYLVLLAILAQNQLTHNVFRITAQGGYARAPMILWLYAISSLYALGGVVYLLAARRYLGAEKWVALIAFYLMVFLAVYVQLLFPSYLVEMFATAVVFLVHVLIVLRPEEITDSDTGLLNFVGYQREVRKLVLSRQNAHIIVIRFINANEVRSYLGENAYNAYIRQAAADIGALFKRDGLSWEMYFERPGSLYIVVDDDEYNGQYELLELFAERRKGLDEFTRTGVRLLPRVCHMRCPTDLNSYEDIFYLGHEFFGMVPYEHVYTEASELLCSGNYKLERNIDGILRRALLERRFELHYQPIYSLKERRFSSAEALIRLKDSTMGPISPGFFVPVAESRGLILPIGDFVLEEAYRFLSGQDLDALGLSYVEINLSVVQCLQTDLPEKVRALERKYGVSPERVNFEITETTYDSMGGIMDENVRLLSEQGYAFSLDDYGTGYSNIQRVSKLPLKIIKIDKSLVDGMGEEGGMSILRNTVRMMQDIGKELVVEGVETKETLDKIAELGCDFIQGFYFSQPLPEREFVAFLREHR